jgi:integrase
MPRNIKRQGLYRRAYGIFCFRYRDRHGLWREKSTGTTDRAEALKFKKDWDDDNAEGELPGDKANWTVAQACTKWVSQHAVHLTSPKGRKNEQSYLRQLLRRIGTKKLKSITLDDLRDYQMIRSQEVRERPINLELGILVRVLKENHLWRGDLRGDPSDRNSGYKRLKEPDSEVGDAISEEALRRLESIARTRDTWEVAYCAELLAANCGVRGGEIKKLRMMNVNLAERSIRITRKVTKTRAGQRQVELNSLAMAAITRLHRRAILLGATDPEHFLLPADLSKHTKSCDPLRGGEGFDPTRHQMSWDTAWRNLRKAAGLPKLRFHNLRHTYISRMAELGVSLQVTQAAVGHVSDAITKHYTHIASKVARDAVEKLEQIRSQPQFVDVFLDVAEESEAKLLN